MLRTMTEVAFFTAFDNLSVIQAVLLLCGAFAAYLGWQYRDGRALFTRPRPDLWKVPGAQTFLLGDLPSILSTRGRQLDRFVSIGEEHAAVHKSDPSRAMTFTVPGRRMIDISKPEWLEYVQKTNFRNYQKGRRFHKNLSGLLGDGIFSVDGNAWHLQRKTTAKLFTGNNFRRVISAGLDHNLDRLTTIVGRHADSGQVFDLSDLFFRFTLSSFTEFAFGHDIGALSTETDAPVPFAQAFDYAQVVMNNRFTNPFWPIFEYLNGDHWRVKEATKQIDDFAYGIIAAREEEGLGGFTGEQKKEAAQADMLSLYMSLRDEEGAPLSRKMLRDALLNLVIAGRDTTAQALSWTFFHLLLHPEHIAPLRAEVDTLPSDKVDFDTFREMVQTPAVFMEGLRLHPSVPKNAWEALEDDQIPGGPRIEKGDIVAWIDWKMARDPDVWGKDAKEFKPSRWVDEDGQLVKESQWKAHMFNGGYRLCLGQQLAMYEATAVLASLFREFDFHFAPGFLETTRMADSEYTPAYKGALTLSMAAPLSVRATRRKRQ
ncbi:hypothetical protein JCM6882_003957 [Rhodosporidiobolus microsporus]